MDCVVNGQTKVMGLLGYGIDYTLSPALHNYAIARLRKNNIYLPFNLKSDNFDAFLDIMWTAGAVGFNVTTPLKRLAAVRLGAELKSVNTIYRGKEGWLADSTDAKGLNLGLSKLGTELNSFESIAILGNGGVVLSILEYLGARNLNGPKVAIFRRDDTKDQELKSALPAGFPLELKDFSPQPLQAFLSGKSGECLLIQATSAPSKGESLATFVPALDDFGGFVVDLTYNCKSALLAAASGRGLPCQDGIPMLIGQALLSQRLWWQECLDFDELERKLQTIL